MVNRSLLRENAIWEDSANSNLILIGTVHGDPQGQARAGKLLHHLRPDLVTVEISPFSLGYRLKHGGRWQRQLAAALAELPAGAERHLAIQRLKAQVALPFEVRAARDYSRRLDVPWRPLDLGFLSRRHLPRYATELLTPANLRPCSSPPTANLRILWPGSSAGRGRSGRERPGGVSSPASPRLCGGNGSWPGGCDTWSPGIAGWCTWAAGSTWRLGGFSRPVA